MKDSQEKASSFLIKLLNMLRSKENAKTITWDPQENGIRIFNQQKLEEILLPRYFRHNRYSSFVRQLNMYDFHKVYLPDGESLFYHQIFNPRDKQSVYKIKRKSPPCNDQNNLQPKLNRTKKNNKTQGVNIRKDKYDTCNKKEQYADKSSFKILFKNSSARSQNQRTEQQRQNDNILEQIIAHIAPLKLSKQSIRQKITELSKYTKFTKLLKRSSFLKKIYTKLGIQMDSQDDKLSELSIQQQLMYNTKKSLTLRSLKMFQSGPINLKDTLGMFLS